MISCCFAVQPIVQNLGHANIVRIGRAFERRRFAFPATGHIPRTTPTLQCVKLDALIWQAEEIPQYERLKRDAMVSQRKIPDFIKEIIERALKKNT